MEGGKWSQLVERVRSEHVVVGISGHSRTFIPPINDPDPMHDDRGSVYRVLRIRWSPRRPGRSRRYGRWRVGARCCRIHPIRCLPPHGLPRLEPIRTQFARFHAGAERRESDSDRSGASGRSGSGALPHRDRERGGLRELRAASHNRPRAPPFSGRACSPNRRPTRLHPENETALIAGATPARQGAKRKQAPRPAPASFDPNPGPFWRAARS